jgi:putative sterol carrier protein
MAFGIQTLGELITTPTTRRAVLRLLNRVLSWAVSVLAPPKLDFSYLDAFDIAVEDLYAFSLRSLEVKLGRAGIKPGEVVALVKLGADDPPETQATRALALLRAGMVGDVAPLLVNEETLTLLFEAVERVANMRPAALPVVQWDFTDAEPWYLAPEDGRARVRRGRAPSPALTLRCAALDWARIATEKLDPRVALLTRRMSISGDWRLALRLPSLLGA